MKIEKDDGIKICGPFLLRDKKSYNELFNCGGKVRKVELLTVIIETRKKKKESSIPNVFNDYFLKAVLLIMNKI